MIAINELDTKAPATLYHRYPGQTEPQPCYLSLLIHDDGNGELVCDWDSTIGSGSYHRPNEVQSWTIPALLPEAANRIQAVLAQSAPIQQIVDAHRAGDPDHSTTDDLHQSVARLIDSNCNLDPECGDVVVVWDAGDWFSDGANSWDTETAPHITADTTDDDLGAIAARLKADALTQNCHAIEWLDEWLTERRDELRGE